MDIKFLLEKLAQINGSDLHIKAGSPPAFRVRGELRKDGEILTKEEFFENFKEVLGEEKFSLYLRERDLDFAIDLGETGRFRGNLFFQKNLPAAVFRLIPRKIPTIESLRLPDIFKEIVRKNQGLILIVGPTGAGKSTTLAALIEEINENYTKNIITVEDPVEFIFEDKKSIISQRELGFDTFSWTGALKRALRQDPDVIMIGEMRDADSIAIAISAAETGHLVFSTLHTNDARQTIERIADSFPENARDFLRHQIAHILVGVISQRLVPLSSADGRIAAFEIMLNSPAISKAIEENKLDRIETLIAESASFYKMRTLNQSLFELVDKNLITEEDAISTSNNPNDLRIKLKTSKVPETQQEQKPLRKF